MIDCCEATLVAESLLKLSSSKKASPLKLPVIAGLVKDLLVRVCDPVSVVTVESMAKVTAPELPPPDKPVPALTAVISADIPAIALVT